MVQNLPVALTLTLTLALTLAVVRRAEAFVVALNNIPIATLPWSRCARSVNFSGRTVSRVFGFGIEENSRCVPYILGHPGNMDYYYQAYILTGSKYPKHILF